MDRQNYTSPRMCDRIRIMHPGMFFAAEKDVSLALRRICEKTVFQAKNEKVCQDEALRRHI